MCSWEKAFSYLKKNREQAYTRIQRKLTVSSYDININKIIVPDNNEHVSWRSSRHVRSLVGMNTPVPVLDEAALREEGRFWDRKKTRTVTTVTRKKKSGQKGRGDEKKWDKSRSNDSDVIVASQRITVTLEAVTFQIPC